MIPPLEDLNIDGTMLVFLDYDGTLVPICSEPRLAVLSPGRRRFLESLGRILRIGIVSGRSLADLRRTVRIDGISYLGNHGLEILAGRWSWVHPGALSARPAVRTALRRIRREIGGTSGLLIEDKGLTASLHVRAVEPALRARVLEATMDEIQRLRPALKVTAGKMVIEIRPNVMWDKGRGILKVSRWMGRGRTAVRVYIGDDRTDEDAFRALGGKDVTIHVGRSGITAARFRISDVDHVWKFLEALGEKLHIPR
jgi:trehalose 6-phosphate phosphatase